MMTPEQIAEIRAREKAATPGPWNVEYDNADERGGGQWYEVGPCRQVGWHSYSATAAQEFQAEDDAEFVSHARTDIPALLDDRDELVARIARLQAVAVAVQRRTEGHHPETPVTVYHNPNHDFYGWGKDCKLCAALTALEPGDLPT